MEQYSVDTLEMARKVPVTRILGMQARRRVAIRCPFHGDETPSCSLYPDGSYYCFGCGAKGKNAIDFMMGLGYTFQEAMGELIKHI